MTNRRFLFVFLGFFLFSQSAMAQFQWGAKIGVNNSFFKVVDQNNFFFFSNEGTLPGLATGFYALIGKDDSNIALRVELLYTVKGGKGFSFSQPQSQFSIASTSLEYLSFPVLFNYHSGPLYLEFGPEFNYLLTAKTNFLDGRPKMTITENLNGRSDLSLGMGMYYDLGHFQVGFRYLQGFATIDDLEIVDFDGFPRQSGKIKNRSVQFWLAYQISK